MRLGNILSKLQYLQQIGVKVPLGLSSVCFNNYLGTFARADIPPYCRDFDTHMPTGRFSNGRLTVDYLAMFTGLPFVPAYLGLAGVVDNMIQSINFAYAGARVLYSNGDDLPPKLDHMNQPFLEKIVVLTSLTNCAILHYLFGDLR